MRKKQVRGRTLLILGAGFLLAGGFLAGCSEDADQTVLGPGSSAVTVTEIFFDPKSVLPGDTVLVTAFPTSELPNVGDFVTFEWSVTGGEWIDIERSDKSTVRWRAPIDNPGVYTFTVKATNSASSATVAGLLFVGRLEPFIARGAGQLFMVPGTEALYYTSGPGDAKQGLALRLKDGATDEVVYPNHLGTQYSFDANRTREAHTHVERILYEKTVVVYDDLLLRTQKTIARDEREFAPRWRRFSRPNVSPDGRWICYQGALLASDEPSQGGVDTFAVFVYDTANESTRRATFRGNSQAERVSTSFYPTISTDNRHVVFVSNRDDRRFWEYYALPIQAGGVVPDTVPNALLKLSDTNGRITSGGSQPDFVAVHQWNPNPANPILASVGADKKLRLIRTDGTRSSEVDAAGEVTDLVWAPDGQYLVASVWTGEVNHIYRISVSGVDPRVLWTARPGERIAELSVSPDGAVVVYSNKRGSSFWYELVATDREEGDGPSVRISAAWSARGALDYGPPLQSLRPVWARTGRVAYLFFLDGDKPRVAASVDLSAIDN